MTQTIDSAMVRVEPFGSESHGLALVAGGSKGGEAEISMICAYDRKTKAVEIGGELPGR